MNINNGQLTKGGIGVRDLILKDPSQAGPDSSDTASNDYQPNEGDLLFQYAPGNQILNLSLIHISEPTRLRRISYAVFCLKKKNYA